MDPPSLNDHPPPTMAPPPPPSEIDIPAAIPAEHSLPTAEQLRSDSALSSRPGDAVWASWRHHYNRNRKLWIVGGISLLALVAIVGLSVGIANSSSGNNDAAASAPASTSSSSSSSSSSPSDNADLGYTRASNKASRLPQVTDFLSFFSNRDDLEERGSPQNLAAVWMADEDDYQVDLPSSHAYGDAFRFVQRYVLAVLYYSTNGPAWTHESRLGWLSDKDECLWNFDLSSTTEIPASGASEWTMGVQCDDDREVDYLYLPANNLEGALPFEFGELIALKHLSLFDNNLAGPLPPGMGDMTDMSFLAAESNSLSGPVPDWVNKMTKLKYLALGDNQFTGQLPSFDQLTDLQEVSLDKNRLTGTADVFNSNTQLKSLFLQKNGLSQQVDDDLFANLIVLETLDMSSNFLVGTIPQHFYQMTTLDLHNNSISGELPEVLGLRQLKFLSLYENEIGGVIPESIRRLSSLTHLDLSYNKFTGPMPGTNDTATLPVNELTELRYLFLARNDFDLGKFPDLTSLVNLEDLSLKGTNRDGDVPHFIGKLLKNLVLLDLHDNGFSGPIPDTLGALPNLRFLFLNRNELTGELPDEFGNLQSLEVLHLDKNRMRGDSDPICMSQTIELDSFIADCQSDVECDCNCECCAEDDLSCNSVDWSANIDDGYERNQYVFSENIQFEANTEPAQ